MQLALKHWDGKKKKSRNKIESGLAKLTAHYETIVLFSFKVLFHMDKFSAFNTVH